MKGARLLFLILIGILLAACGSPSVKETDFLETSSFRIQDLKPGPMSGGKNTFRALVTNRTDQTRYLVMDIRSEGLGLGRANWQRPYSFRFDPGESRRIEVEYEISAPLLARLIIRFGELEEYFDFDEFVTSLQEGRNVPPPPEVNYQVTHIIVPGEDYLEKIEMGARIDSYSSRLNRISPEERDLIKSRLSEIIKRSRNKRDEKREQLRELLRIDRPCPEEFDPRKEDWSTRSAYLNSLFEKNFMSVEVFSIAGEKEQRIKAFFSSPQKKSARKMPLILLLSGNPPGMKESLVGAALFFGRLGYLTVGIDRRPSARILDKKEKFLANYADPVFDLLRLLDFLEAEYKDRYSRIGLIGFSAGAKEGLLAVALDSRIEAAVLAAGISSNNWLFKNEAWFPTYSGMIIFPELGLGNPEIGKLTPEEFRENLNKLKPEHNSRALKIYRKIFPFFDLLDSLQVGPLAAPVPVMIVTGARDEQFLVIGAAEVEEAMGKKYLRQGLSPLLEFVVQPRAGHTVDIETTFIIAAFFRRWLK